MREGLVTIQATGSPKFVYRFDGGDYFTEPYVAFLGNFLKMQLCNADVIVTKMEPMELSTA